MSNFPIKIVSLSPEQAKPQEGESGSYQMLELEPAVPLDLINSESNEMLKLKPSVQLELIKVATKIAK